MSESAEEQPVQMQEYDVTYIFLRCGAAKNKRGFVAEPRVDENGKEGIFLREVWKGTTAHRVSKGFWPIRSHYFIFRPIRDKNGSS